MRGLQVSYCQTKHYCQQLRNIQLHMKGDVLEFDIVTENAEKLKGSVKLEKIAGRGVVCG